MQAYKLNKEVQSEDRPLEIAYFLLREGRVMQLVLSSVILPFQQILPTLTFLPYSLDCLHDHGTVPDLSCSSVYF